MCVRGFALGVCIYGLGWGRVGWWSPRKTPSDIISFDFCRKAPLFYIFPLQSKHAKSRGYISKWCTEVLQLITSKRVRCKSTFSGSARSSYCSWNQLKLSQVKVQFISCSSHTFKCSTDTLQNRANQTIFPSTQKVRLDSDEPDTWAAWLCFSGWMGHDRAVSSRGHHLETFRHLFLRASLLYK